MIKKSSAVCISVLVLALMLSGTSLAMDTLAAENHIQESNPDSVVPEMVSGWNRNIDLLGQIGGSINTVVLQGNYAYLGVGPRLVIVDISDPQQPVLLGRTTVFPAIVEYVAVDGDYAYVAGGDSLGGGSFGIINVSQPDAPVEVSHLDAIVGYVTDMAFSGDFIYLASYDDSYLYPTSAVEIIDVSIPIPTYVGIFFPRYYINALAVSESYTYVADEMGLEIFDITQPAHTKISTFAIEMGAADIAVEGIYAYVIDNNGILHIMDVSVPSTPFEVGFYDLSGSYLRGISVVGDLAYLYGENLHIIDVSIPSTPDEVGSYETPACDMAIMGKHAYISNCEDSLRIIDVSPPSSPFEIGSYDLDAPGYTRDVVLAGKYAYLTTNNGVHIVDVSIPGMPVRAGYFSTPGPVDDITVFGDYAYVSDYDDGVYIIDISNPSNPIETSFYAVPGYVGNVTVNGEYAYIAQLGDGLHILDVSQPSNPTKVGYIDIYAKRVIVKGDLAYVINNSFGDILFIDVSAPSDPIIVGTYTTGRIDRDLTVVGNYAYILSDGVWDCFTHSVCSRLSIIDITSLSNPFEVGFAIEHQAFYKFALLGGNVFLAGDYLLMINMGVPSGDKIEMGHFYTPETALGIDGVDDRIYVADGKGGLYIFYYNPLKVYLPLLQRNP